MRPLAKPDGLVDTVTASAQASEDISFFHLPGLPKVVSVRRTATAQVVGAQGGPVCPWGIVADTSGAAVDGKGNFGLTPGRIYALTWQRARDAPATLWRWTWRARESAATSSRLRRVAENRRRAFGQWAT